MVCKLQLEMKISLITRTDQNMSYFYSGHGLHRICIREIMKLRAPTAMKHPECLHRRVVQRRQIKKLMRHLFWAFLVLSLMGSSMGSHQVHPGTTSKFVKTFRVCSAFLADHFGIKFIRV